MIGLMLIIGWLAVGVYGVWDAKRRIDRNVERQYGPVPRTPAAHMYLLAVGGPITLVAGWYVSRKF